MSYRFAYTMSCTGCSRHWPDEVWPDSFLRFDPLRDVHAECPQCGPLGDLKITRRIPVSSKVERRQLGKNKRTPMCGTPRVPSASISQRTRGRPEPRRREA